MKKISSFLSVLVLLLLFTACLVEDSSLSAPAVGSSPLIRTLVSPDAMVGLQFSMAEIQLRDQNNRSYGTQMPSCYLSVEERNCSADCAARLDEGGSTLFLRNQVNVIDNTERIRFSRAATPSRGTLSFFLEDQVFVFLQDADWTITQTGRDFHLNCDNCPVEYLGTTYVTREIRLRP